MKPGTANYTKSGGCISIYCQKCYTTLGLNRAKLNDTAAGHHDEPVEPVEPETTEAAPEATEAAPEPVEAAPEEDAGDSGDRPELD